MSSRFSEGRDYWLVLATVALRRLLRLRHHPKHGTDARTAARQWIGTLRSLEEQA